MSKTKKTAYIKCLDLLARQDYSKEKLTNKLIQTGYEIEEISEAIKKLEERKLINEHEYGKRKIQALALKGKHPSLIQIELEKENIFIEQSEIQDLVKEEGLDAHQQIIKLIEKKSRMKNISQLDSDTLFKFKQKILRYVLSKGHPYDETKALVEEIVTPQT